MLVTDPQIAVMNRRYRAMARPTDVLTFMYQERPLVGEVYISADTARWQACERHVHFTDELLRLTIHGLAHLAGYGHASPEAFCQMRKKEFETLLQIL